MIRVKRVEILVQWCSLNTVNMCVWEGGNPVQEKSSISFDQEDRESLEEVTNGHTLLLACLPDE